MTISLNDSITNTEKTNKAIEALEARLVETIAGNKRAINLTIISLIIGGHILLEDVPGTGKTTLAKRLAEAIKGEFGRVQGSPELIPSDITGAEVYDQSTNSFRFVRGPIFADLVLVDEGNRMSRSTHAALLEAMEERKVTVGNNTYSLPSGFMVISTQNPSDQEGAWDLASALQDRYSMCIPMEMPTEDQECAIARGCYDKGNLQAVMSVEDLVELRSEVRQITIPSEINTWAVQCVRRTRDMEKYGVLQGASPRATRMLIRAAQGCAAMRGAMMVSEDDVRAVAVPVLSHRLVMEYEAKLTPENAIKSAFGHEPAASSSNDAAATQLVTA